MSILHVHRVEEYGEAGAQLAQLIRINRDLVGGYGSRSFVADLVRMLYDEAQAKRKLRAAYRGPFVIVGYGGDHERSYVLRQIAGQPIYRTFHGDQPKLFRPREGYLIPKHEKGHLSYQNIRGKSTYSKLPSSATKGRLEKNS